MGGHPLWRLALTIGGLLLLFPLVLQLTKTATVAAGPVAEVAPSAASAVTVEITFTQPVQQFAVEYSGRQIWTGESASGTVQRVLSIPFPPEGIDLKIQGIWADGSSENAVRVTVTPPGQAPVAQTTWARGRLDEVLTFVEATP